MRDLLRKLQKPSCTLIPARTEILAMQRPNHGLLITTKRRLGTRGDFRPRFGRKLKSSPSQAQSRVSNLSTTNKSQCFHAKFGQSCLDAIRLSVQGHGYVDFSLDKPQAQTAPHARLSTYPSRIPLSFRLLNRSGSKNLLMVTSSARPFLRRVLSTKSLAVACAEAGSSGRSLISLSSGSPGTIDQRSKTRETVAWPCVWICYTNMS